MTRYRLKIYDLLIQCSHCSLINSELADLLESDGTSGKVNKRIGCFIPRNNPLEETECGVREAPERIALQAND